MTSLPQMYQPTASEIATVAASALRRHPQLSSRIGKASDLLLDGSLQLEPVAWEKRAVTHWRIASQSHGGAYIVTAGQCPCQDRRTKFCKHSIAVSLYTKVLANRLNSDIQAREIDLAILPDRSFNCYAKRLGCVRLRKVGPAYIFADSASAVRYSIWLAQRSVNWTAALAVEEWPSAVADCVFA